MSDREQNTAKVIIGTLVFVILFAVVYLTGLPSFAVSYAKPNLAAGSFSFWEMITTIVSPVVGAYVSVTTKIGSGVVSLVAAIIHRVQSPPVTAPQQTSSFVTHDELDAYARKGEVVATIKAALEKSLKPIQSKIDQHDTIIQAWEDQ